MLLNKTNLNNFFIGNSGQERVNVKEKEGFFTYIWEGNKNAS